MVKLTPELADQIIDLILDGKTQQLIAAELGLPVNRISKWAIQYPLFAERLRAAREEAAHVMVDDSIYIADTDTDSKSARVRMQARQFAAERRNRKAYAPSIDMTLDQRVDIGGTLLEARKRIALPGSSLALSSPSEDVEYTLLSAPSATDTQTAEPVPFVNPFD
jgi:alkanesulfonate monooxygenase SsuD/methylene tetrahydromethanopterin reductase-like flavin-dependent oxidoreductase (luciferase family)